MLFVKTRGEAEEQAFITERLGYPDLRIIHDRTNQEAVTACYPESKNECLTRIENYLDDVRSQYSKNVPCKVAHIVVTHGINVANFAMYGDQHCQVQGHVRLIKYVNYVGICAGTIVGNGMRITHGGNNNHLRDEAAEIHLEKRLAGNDQASFAIKAVANARFDNKFKNFINDMDRSFMNGQSNETKLEIYALFSQATQGDAKDKDFSKVPEEFVAQTVRKHEAWQAKLGMNTKDAKKGYMKLVNGLRAAF